MSLYIPKMSDTPGVTIPGLASNFQALDGSQIVEWGSNENGEYIRWENGLQMCRFAREIIELTESIPPGGSSGLTFAYPASFSSPPALAVGGLLTRPGWYTVNSTITLYSRYTWRANVIVRNVEGAHSGSQLRYVSVLAIGRWK